MSTILINPGSGNVRSGAQEQSEINIQKFTDDLGVDAAYEFIEIDETGRHLYILKNGKHMHEIAMPAIPLHEVRYVSEAGQHIGNFPRLYVDGASWIWKFALGVCFNNGDR